MINFVGMIRKYSHQSHFLEHILLSIYIIKKIMGWCPDYNIANQIQYNQFTDEKIHIDDNGRNNIDLT